MATSSRGERLRYRYGICLNDSCSKCKSKEVQQIAARKEFVCAECMKPLRECPPPQTFWQKNGKIVIGAVAVAVLAVAGIVIGTSRGGNAEPEVKPVVVEDTIKKDTVAVDTTKVVKPETDKKVKKDDHKTKPITGRGTVYFDYGKYTGDLKNGKPHGYGTITYTKTTQIVSSKDFVANPGDTFEGEFRDGRISGQGYWTHDGNQTAVKP